MNDDETMARQAAEATDEEILRGIRQRMATVETLIPVPPAWNREEASGSVPGRVRSSVRFAVAPLVIVVALIVVAIGAGLGARSGSVPASATPQQSAPTQVTILIYKLIPPVGQTVSAGQLSQTASIMKARVDAAGATTQIVVALPDRVSVIVSGSADLSAIEKLIGRPGRLEFVLLPPATYGTSDAPGSKPIPADGAALDPALPAQFTGADLDRDQVAAMLDPNSAGSWLVDFAFTPTKAAEFEAWTGQHVNNYLAITIDGVVQSVPYIFSAVTGGNGQITGGYTEGDAKELTAILKSGELPLPIKLESEDTSRFNQSAIATPTPTPTPMGPAVTVPASFLSPSPGSSATIAPLPTGGLTRERAIELAAQHSTLQTFVSADAGRFADLNTDTSIGPGNVAANRWVWAVTFTGSMTICPPPVSRSPQPCHSPVPGKTTVFLDYLTGAFLLAGGSTS